MQLARAIVLSVPLAALAVTHVRDVSACGGYFVQQTENTQVTSHSMILSISVQQTTLWDQIVYSGAPDSFAWVLPIKGTVTIDLSSDALFQNLDQLTQVSVTSPEITCPLSPDCGFGTTSGSGTDGAGTAGSGGAGGGGVTVIAEEVVGPYETVQLMSSDPSALTNWLLAHGYNIPPDITPVINAYVNESFNFLALKLVPGQGIDSMRPVRVTTPGASLVLPLRMVAAGAGTTTPITLWIMGEGRYEPKNFATFLINPNALVWNWDTSSSNYRDLRDAGFTTNMGQRWLVEAGEPFSRWSLSNRLIYLARYLPLNSGYADELGQGALASCAADLDALFGLIPDSSLWVTRIYGELSRAALGTDLDLQAVASQAGVQRDFHALNEVGTPPCPTYQPCSSTIYSGSGGGGCAMDRKAATPVTFAAAAVLLGLGLLRRRNRRAPFPC